MLEAAKPMRKPVEETQYLEEDPGWGNTADAHQGIFEAQPQDLDALARQAGLDKNEARVSIRRLLSLVADWK